VTPNTRVSIDETYAKDIKVRGTYRGTYRVNGDEVGLVQLDNAQGLYIPLKYLTPAGGK